MQCQKSRQAIRDITQAALRLNKSPLVWAIDVCTCLQELDEGKIPSIELADVLVSESLSLDGSSEILAYLNYAMVSHLVYPLHALALLTTRVIPVRHQQIEMYSAYLGLANAYLFSLALIREVTCCDRLLKAVVEALQPPYSTGKSIAEFGTNLIHFLLCLLYKLAQAIAEDWSLPSIGSDRQSKSLNAGTHNFGCHTARAHCMNVEDDMNSLRRGESERQKKKNSLKALDVVVKILQNRKTVALLRLAQRNLPEQWRMVLPKLQMLEVLAQDPLPKAPNEAMDLIKDLSDCIQHDLEQTWKSTNVPFIKVLSGGSSLIHTFLATGVATIWLPFDIFMEDAMEGRRVSVTSTAEALTELMKSLQAFYGATWHDLFLGLWIAALRLVSREREFIEGPKPHVESRLCMLLSIVPLACSIVIEEEEKNQQLSCREDIPLECNTRFEKNEERKTSYSRRRAFKCSLQVLAQFNYLLMPPAVEAATCMSQNPKMGVHDAQVSNDVTVSKAVGNMRQLILDACIARGLVDTSAYTWPGYIGSVVSVGHTLSTQSSPWVAFMEGAPLSGTLKFALASTPAGSLAELEKAYQTAVNGLDDDRASAASILCGASLLCAWNVQEHAVRLAMQLLSHCSDSKDWAGHCLLPHAPMLLSVLKALSSNDAINVLNLHGKFPELATSLLPICEYFGTISPTVPLTASSVDISNNMLFSYAFLLLHRLWKFSQAPLGYQLLGKLLPLGSKLNLESLLELRNLKMLSSKTSLAAIDRHQTTDQVANRGIDGPRTMDPDLPSSVKGVEVVSLDSYPNLKAWYLQDQACITSALCGAAKGDDVQKLIDMMFRKINSTRNASLPTGCPNTTSSSTEDDIAGRPLLAPWDILAAIPFVVDKVITACAHGILSSRDLTTGLSDLLNYFPASIAPIVSYFTAEVIRGSSKSASMNGNDWPSPAANLMTIGEEMKNILASAGVLVPDAFKGALVGNAPASLPLPLAALVSLTITLKVDEPYLVAIMGLAGPGLAFCASGCPWPSMPVVAALWAQKMRKWHDFIISSATRTVFQQDKDSVRQLLRNCFAVTIGSATSLLPRVNVIGGVSALFGDKNFSPGSQIPVAPGILYLRVYPSLHDTIFIASEILLLVIEAARNQESKVCVQPRSVVGTQSKRPPNSFAHCTARALQASILGASLLFVSGGPTLVQTLFMESLPTFFLSGYCFRNLQTICSGDTVLEGYVIAHFSILSAVLAWGISLASLKSTSGLAISPNDSRKGTFGFHMDFLASVLEERISIGCGQITWKSYVVTFLALIVTCAPSWIRDVKPESLKIISKGLRFWKEHALAVALLERGGPAAMSVAAEIIIS